jgi:hypothetical protein
VAIGGRHVYTRVWRIAEAREVRAESDADEDSRPLRCCRRECVSPSTIYAYSDRAHWRTVLAWRLDVFEEKPRCLEISRLRAIDHGLRRMPGATFEHIARELDAAPTSARRAVDLDGIRSGHDE